MRVEKVAKTARKEREREKRGTSNSPLSLRGENDKVLSFS